MRRKNSLCFLLSVTTVLVLACAEKPAIKPHHATGSTPPLRKEFRQALSVGVLLPLSGRYRIPAESVLHGLECAAGIFKPCRTEQTIRLVIRDTGEGNPEATSRALEELALEGVHGAIVLPVDGELEALAEPVKRLNLPTVLLTPRTDAASWLGGGLFRNFLTIPDQVRTIVDYACQGKKDFAILFPQTPVGTEFEKEFSQKVEACGGRVTARQSYEAETVDFTEALRGLKLNRSKFDLNAALGFEALFIPDTYRKTLLACEAMKFLGMQGVLLMGGAGWDHPSLAEDTSGLLEGAIFADGFFPRSDNKVTRDFTDRFEAAFSFSPTLIEAYAYDALRLQTLGSPLTGLKDFDGATGPISFEKDGEGRRKLFLLTVDRNEIRQIP